MNGESSMEACTLIYVQQTASGNLLYYAGSSDQNLVPGDNLEGWDCVGGGREVEEGKDTYIPMADSC